jgi:hypothetical protein
VMLGGAKSKRSTKTPYAQKGETAGVYARETGGSCEPKRRTATGGRCNSKADTRAAERTGHARLRTLDEGARCRGAMSARERLRRTRRRSGRKVPDRIRAVPAGPRASTRYNDGSAPPAARAAPSARRCRSFGDRGRMGKSLGVCSSSRQVLRGHSFGRQDATWLLSPGGRKAIVKVASSTSGLHTLSISKVENLPIPLPPLAEQTHTVRLGRLSSMPTSACSTSLKCVLYPPASKRQIVLRRPIVAILLAVHLQLARPSGLRPVHTCRLALLRVGRFRASFGLGAYIMCSLPQYT